MRSTASRWVIGTVFIGTVLLALAALPPSESIAKERTLEFIHALQKRGYGEQAVDELEAIKSKGDLPTELAETFDLEMSNSLRAAAEEAFNAAQKEERLASAQTYLDKFLKEHPESEDAGTAGASWGELAFQRGLQNIGSARNTNDPEQKAKFLADARAAFEEARPRFLQSAESLKKKLEAADAALPQEPKDSHAPKKPPKRPANDPKQAKLRDAREDAEFNYIDAIYKLARLEYCLAQTYGDGEDAPRKAALEKAARAFDDIFQRTREKQTGQGIVGLYAHLMDGRCRDEMGDLETAMDIYDEVEVVRPDPKEKNFLMEGLYTQVEYFRMLILLKKEGNKAFLKQADAWIKDKDNKSFQKSDGYQGVLLEKCKAQLAESESASPEEKRKLVRDAILSLTAISKMPGEHKFEASLLLRKFRNQDAPTDPSEIKSFTEAIALGDDAVQNSNWEAAMMAFGKAVELAKGPQEEKQKPQVQDKLDQARFNVAVKLFGDNKLAEVIELSAAIVKNSKHELAPRAATLAINSALRLYAAEAEKTAKDGHLKKLMGITEFTIKTWPDKPEADDARLALGQASLVRNEYPEAIKVFENVNPQSTRYAGAMFLAGQTHCRLYRAEKSKPPAQRDDKVLEEHRDKSEKELAESLEFQLKVTDRDANADRQLTDTRLLLSEIYVDKGVGGKATDLLMPLLEPLKSAPKDQPIDQNTRRTFIAAIQAFLAGRNVEKAVEVTLLLAGTGPETPDMNLLVMAFARKIADGVKALDAAAIEANNGTDVAQIAATKSALDAARASFANLLRVLSTRQVDLGDMVFIADNCKELNEMDLAATLYQKVLTDAEAKPEFAEKNKGLLTKIRSQLVDMLGQRGKFAEADAAVKKLCEDYPNAMEPLFTRGRILESWAATDPTKFDDAVAHWTSLRTRMEGLKQKPPEYYKVVYSVANCLVQEYQKTKNVEKLNQAQKLLKAILFRSPKLDGPDTVARYNGLLAKAQTLAGEKKPPKKADGEKK